ncbi:unnamed protein product, partial [Brassica rapa]
FSRLVKKLKQTTYMFLIRWYSCSTHLKVYILILDIHLNVFGYEGFLDLEDFWDDLHTTSRKSSRRLLFQSSELPGSRLDFLKLHGRSNGSRLDFLKVVWTSSKSSGLPGSRLEVVWTSWKS